MNHDRMILLTTFMAVTLILSVGTFALQNQNINAQQVPSKVVIGVVGDIDCKTDRPKQTTQYNAMKSFLIQLFFVPGDYAYNGASCVLNDLTARGFKANNSAIADGNHDSCDTTKNFMKMSNCWGVKSFFNGKIEAFLLQGDTSLSTTSNQYKAFKTWAETSKAMYKFVIIHQPFVTARSEHGANGFFETYHPIIAKNNVSMVLQAHNHNEQVFKIDGVYYTISGRGHHDEGSNLYEIDGNSFKTYPLLFGNDSVNGFMILTLDMTKKHIKADIYTDAKSKQYSFEITAPIPPPANEVCGNGIDDNGNGQIDENCPPPPPPPVEICGNDIDDDLDGLIDEDCGPTTVNQTFSVPVGNGTAIFAPANQNQSANVTVAVDAGIAILPKP